LRETQVVVIKAERDDFIKTLRLNPTMNQFAHKSLCAVGTERPGET
jgi:hypothetical protein